MIYNCRKTAMLLSKGLDADLSFFERVGLKIHLALCASCRNMAMQMGFIKEAVSNYTDDFLEIDDPEMELSVEARQRIKSQLSSI